MNDKDNSETFDLAEYGKAKGGIANSQAIQNFVTGCMTRERQRIAKLLRNCVPINAADREVFLALAEAIEKPSAKDDEAVFQWASRTRDFVP